MLKRKAQSIVEYVLLLSVIIGALITALTQIGTKTQEMVYGAANVLNTQIEQFQEKACGGAPTGTVGP
jgi:Flp pilus assembly pilin Flp